ncbi:MAG TPA: XTP/dITP diphosphatase [Firmicutes bacterium]|nr:XTP/dITP diphosphatase [Bacillota bacterium]
MFQLVLATNNIHKVKEVESIIGDIAVIKPLSAFPGAPAVEETGSTFAENAVLKAKAAAAHTGWPALADDSGLEVTALGGKPGVFSARFAGPSAGDEGNNAKLLEEMRRVPPGQREARFVCCMALAWPDGKVWTTTGTHSGWILMEPRGKNGFGYDPLFYSPELGMTFAEAPPEMKNRVSHRARALAGVRNHLLSL